MTARSEAASLPTSVASYLLPLFSCTSTALASSTTWLQVRIYPSSAMMTPLPELTPSVVWPQSPPVVTTVARMTTTESSTMRTTSEMAKGFSPAEP